MVALTPHASASFTFAPAATSKLRRIQIAHARRKHQRGLAPVRDRLVVREIAVRRNRHHVGPDIGLQVEIGVVRQQHLHHFGMLLRYGPHQRRLAARAVRIRIRALREQLFDDVGIARARSHHHRRFARQQRAGSDWRPLPAASSTMAELPFSLAGHSGVTPRSVAAFTLAPARISRSALSRSSR